MKKFMVCIVLLPLFSCEEVFYNDKNEIQNIRSEEDVVNAVTGVYSMLAMIFGDAPEFSGYPIVKSDDNNYYFEYSSLFTLQNSDTIYVPGSAYATDEICYITRDGKETEAGFYGIVWQRFYRAIASANNIIVQVSAFRNPEANVKEMLGEAYFLRAYCYYRLVRTFGELPLIDNIDVSYHVNRSSMSDIFAFIESDLLKAKALLPANNAEARVPFATLHKGAAKAFLAELYLSMAGYPVNDHSKYVLAAKEAGEVIDSAVYFGFRLLPDFADLWNGKKPMNEESVFTLYYIDDFTSNDQRSVNRSTIIGMGMLYQYDDLSIFRRNSSSMFDMWAIWSMYPGVKFYNTYPESYRKEITFTRYLYKWTGAKNQVWHINKSSVCTPVYYRKFLLNTINYVNANPASIDQATYGNTIGIRNPIYLFRFTHVLLTYAEARARSGDLDESAFEALNKVRRRAHRVNPDQPSIYDLQPGLSVDQFTDSLVWERAWEHAGEQEGRWWDMVRLEMVEKMYDLVDPSEIFEMDGPFDRSYYFEPVPNEDVDFDIYMK